MHRHSVDSAISLRSQHHADRIRWPARARYSQRRSVSELELASRPAPVPPRSNDLEYLDNPAENLEFAQRRLQHQRPQRNTRPEDDYYRHLTARAQDRWWHGSQGILQAPAAIQAALPLPGLRRSRSLAVIREENCPGPLIPRARLADKPLYKERFLPRSKFQTKEEALERIYNKSTSSCYGDVSDNPNQPSDEITLSNEGIYEETNNQVLPREKKTSVNGWVNADGIISTSYAPHPEENGYSHNPSEIDSLDSNYIHKNYNFEAHNQGVYKESSPDTTDHDLASEPIPKVKLLFIRNDQNEKGSEYYLPKYNETSRSDSDRSTDNSAPKNVAKSQTNFHVLDQSNSEDNGCESSISSCEKITYERDINQPNSSAPIQVKKNSDTSESESTNSIERITTRPDKDNISVTSYVSVPNSSPESSPRRLENLAYSLAEKIDEYCESKYCESFVEIPLNLNSTNNSFNSKSFDDLNHIYTQVKKLKPDVVKSEPKVKHKDSLERYQKNSPSTENQINKQYSDKFKSNQEELKTRSLYRQGSSSRNITTEPFVTTLIENQYYSLPDINISKSLRRSERIDAKLRQSEESDDPSYFKRLELTHKNNTAPAKVNLKQSLNEVSVIEVKGEEENADESLTVSVQRDRKVEETELQIHKAENDIVDTNKNDSDDLSKLKEVEPKHHTSVVRVDGVIIEVERKLSNAIVFDDEIKQGAELLTNGFSENKSDLVHKDKVITDLPLIPVNNKIKIVAKEKEENKIKQNGVLHATKSFTEKDLAAAKNQLNSTAKNRTSITKHYSLRQRDPKTDSSPGVPAPPSEEPQNKDTDKTTSSNSTDKLYTATNVPKAQSHSAAIYDVVFRENRQVQRIHSFKSREKVKNNSFREENNITILPLSGHQTIVVDAPISKNNFVKQKVPINNDQISHVVTNKANLVNGNNAINDLRSKSSNDTLSDQSNEDKELQQDERYHSEGEITTLPKQIQLPRVKKERSLKIAAAQTKFEKPPSRLIIKDNKVVRKFDMSRPQVINVTDNRKPEMYRLKSNGVTSSSESDSSEKSSPYKNGTPNKLLNIYNVTEKVDKVVKTDLEYQEKLHSVKNYWSKLIDKSGDEIDSEIVPEVVENNMRECLPDEPDNINHVTSVENIIKSIETVKIVDSIKKNPCEMEIIDVWKKIDEPEKEKAESEIEESTLKKIIYDSGILIEKACNSIEETANESAEQNGTETSDDAEYKSFSPDIEIVELKNCEQVYQGDRDVTHATLIKTKGYDQENGEFDHVRYKVMKSDLFRKSMIANYKKEAQFDGLLQYLQDYSFQELLVNNNIVIIEPVRTKIETNQAFNSPYKRPNSCRIAGATTKQCNETKEENNENPKPRKMKQPGIKRHFFYHPIRVNREIIEEELPNPDTVKTVRNIFERTLTMRKPNENSDPSLEKDSDTSKKSNLQKNLTDDSKLDKSVGRKKALRYLTIDTSYGQRKWDSASLSSGVSSGDLSSNNEHDYDTDVLSPFPPTKENNENIYCSSSEEYLCESLNPSLCYESQYVSQDILQKIRECGTSITYYGGKVLDEMCGPAVSPMTKQIMEEIRGLQRNCCRDCESCQTKCSGGKCDCLYSVDSQSKSETASVIDDDRISKCCACSEIMEKNERHLPDCDKLSNLANSDNYLGFKFKLVKSNSCSSRLELAGTGEEGTNRRCKSKKKDQDEILYDNENSVKTKICRIESYRKGITSSPFNAKTNENKCDTTNTSDKPKLADKVAQKNISVNTHRILTSTNGIDTNSDKIKRNRNVDLAFNTNSDKASDATLKEDTSPKNNCSDKDVASEPIEANKDVITSEQKTVAETIKCFSGPNMFEKKYYYINSDNILNGERKSGTKFGEMVFEEFEVLESAYDSLKNVEKK